MPQRYLTGQPSGLALWETQILADYLKHLPPINNPVPVSSLNSR